jgi:hypothetical protein
MRDTFLDQRVPGLGSPAQLAIDADGMEQIMLTSSTLTVKEGQDTHGHKECYKTGVPLSLRLPYSRFPVMTSKVLTTACYNGKCGSQGEAHSA